MILEVEKMSSTHFKRIKSVHCFFVFFLRVIQYIVKMKKKREILLNFLLSRKI